MADDNAELDDQSDWHYPTKDEYPPEHRNGPFTRNGIRASNPHFWEELKKDRISEEDAFETFRYGKTYEDVNGTIIKFHPEKKIAIVIGNDDPDFVVTVYKKSEGKSDLWDDIPDK